MDEVNKEMPTQEPPVEGQSQESTSITGNADSDGDESTVGQPASKQPLGESVGTQQPIFQQPVQLPPGYVIDPATGQAVFVGYQQPIQPGYVQPTVMYAPQQPTPEQIAAQQAVAQQRYGVIMQSVESFVEGEATVSDVVKTLYANTAQDDQLWKGLLVGAAATVLLTSGPVREAMGKTFGNVFPGLKGSEKPTVKTEKSESKVSQSSPEKE